MELVLRLPGAPKPRPSRLLEELERAWLKCLPGRQAAGRNELMRALPTELVRKLAANPRFRPAPASSLIIDSGLPKSTGIGARNTRPLAEPRRIHKGTRKRLPTPPISP
jgi:hypothetical protein